MSTQQQKVAKNLERFRQGVRAHDELNPSHSPAYGIGITHFDLNCLGFEEGEELWSGVKVYRDEGGTGNFRVLCHQEQNHVPSAVARETVPA